MKVPVPGVMSICERRGRALPVDRTRAVAFQGPTHPRAAALGRRWRGEP